MRTIAFATVSILFVGGCASTAGAGAGAGGGATAAAGPAAVSPGAAPRRSLYDRLGGKGAITAVVDDFLVRVGQDRRINSWFANADMPRLRAMLIDQICEASGGPCRYTGKDMKTMHVGMQIGDAEFDALVADLIAALDRFQVPATERQELLGALAPMRPDIVEPPVGAVAATSAPPSESLAARARSLREAAGFLDRAGAARTAANRALADVLFSSAELIVGVDALADLAPLFRQGAPPRVNSAPKSVPRDSAPQPAAVGNSDEEQLAEQPNQQQPNPQEQPPEQPRNGSLSGTVILPGDRPLQGLAVVTLEPASGKFRRRAPRQRTIEQRNREFFPKVLAVPVGSTVSFPNFDNVFHNVFSRSDPHPFDLGIYRSGQARELIFDREGVVRVGCNLHANMSAYVVAVSAPHYGITDARGRFRFRSLDPGRYRMRVWSEYVEAPLVRDIEIKPTQNAVTVTLVLDRPAGPLADKFGATRGKPAQATAHR